MAGDLRSSSWSVGDAVPLDPETNLLRRYPHASLSEVQAALRDANGHAGLAAGELRKLRHGRTPEEDQTHRNQTEEKLWFRKESKRDPPTQSRRRNPGSPVMLVPLSPLAEQPAHKRCQTLLGHKTQAESADELDELPYWWRASCLSDDDHQAADPKAMIRLRLESLSEKSMKDHIVRQHNERGERPDEQSDAARLQRNKHTIEHLLRLKSKTETWRAEAKQQQAAAEAEATAATDDESDDAPAGAAETNNVSRRRWKTAGLAVQQEMARYQAERKAEKQKSLAVEQTPRVESSPEPQPAQQPGEDDGEQEREQQQEAPPVIVSKSVRERQILAGSSGRGILTRKRSQATVREPVAEQQPHEETGPQQVTVGDRRRRSSVRCVTDCRCVGGKGNGRVTEPSDAAANTTACKSADYGHGRVGVHSH
jgi:hypothetical protein